METKTGLEQFVEWLEDWGKEENPEFIAMKDTIDKARALLEQEKAQKAEAPVAVEPDDKEGV